LVQLILDHGADPSARDDSGMTALMHAAEDGQVRIIQELITKGVDVNAVSKRGDTALSLAARHDRRVAVDLLKRAGATSWAVASTRR